ncbi:phosphoglycerate kinase [Malacoplasma muris]|uniref:phosphoglycerate kinase n=1 Tax=Malacoplasma muris TaxID=2119 RepID=UPI00398F7FB5
MIYDKKNITDINVDNKNVIVRVDFNVPISNGVVVDDKRIKEALPTINYLLEKNAKIILLSHLGRVKNLDDLKKRTLKPVYNHLKVLLPDVSISFEENNTNAKLVDKIKKMSTGSIILLENTRFNDIDSKGQVVKKESKNDQKLAKFWASLGDVFVNDAFGTSHRAHASNVGIASNISDSCVGFLIEKELKMLSKAINNPSKPVVAIFGGAKISDKIKSIENIAGISDKILIGGGMSYTFQKALGYEIGKSIFEEETLDVARELLKKYGDKIILPIDINASLEFADTKPKRFKVTNFDKSYEGLDIGKKTCKIFIKEIKKAKTIIWNGPLGVCEFNNYSAGTNAICKAIAKYGSKNNAFTLIGGGDSASAAIKLGYENGFSHISTGGGASIQFLEGSDLPGISIIKNSGDVATNKKTNNKSKSVTSSKNSKSVSKPKETKKSITKKSASNKKQNKK